MAAKHRVLDLIATGFQTVDDTGNERRKICINLRSPEQNNRSLRLVSVIIIEDRREEDHRVSCSTVLGSELELV